MHKMSNENDKSTSSRKRRRRSSSSKSKRTQTKDYSKVTGFGLIIVGIATCMYTFGMFNDPSELVHLPDFRDAIQLWPIFIVLIGFVFLIRDYLIKSKQQEWDS